MIEILDMEAKGVIGLRMAGKIEKADMDKVIDAAKSELGEADKLAVYVEMESFDGISFEALLDDLKFGLPNIGKLRRKAVVSDREWVEKAAEISNRLFPLIEVRHFTPDRKDEAKDWVKS